MEFKFKRRSHKGCFVVEFTIIILGNTVGVVNLIHGSSQTMDLSTDLMGN